jgi:hypothetical protein
MHGRKGVARERMTYALGDRHARNVSVSAPHGLCDPEPYLIRRPEIALHAPAFEMPFASRVIGGDRDQPKYQTNTRHIP